MGDSGKSITFIKTGGALIPDTYTVTLRSAANGLIDHNGLMLDGNLDGSAGGDFVQTFTIAPSAAVTVSIPDFARGAGQPVDLGGTGIPIGLSNGAGVQSLDLVIKYNPTLLTITGVTFGSSLPTGSTVEANLTIPGEVHISIAAITPLSAGIAELVRLSAQVPATAPYRATHILDITSVSINEGAIAVIADDALHVAAYFGDATGTGTYSALDGQRTLRVAAGLDSGFANFIKIDPVVIADINGNGSITSLDATRIQQEVVGLDRPEIPPIPGIIVPAPVADPLVNMPTDITGTAGSTVTVPVNIDNANLLESVMLKISYDTNLLDVAAQGIRTGSLTSGGSLLVNVNDEEGTIIVSLLTTAPLSTGAGSLLEIDFQIRLDAVIGATRIDLRSLSLNEGQLVLTIEPVAGADATDGQVTIVSSVKMTSSSSDEVVARLIDSESTTLPQSVAPVAGGETNDTLMTDTSFSVGFKAWKANGLANTGSIKFPTLFDVVRTGASEDLSHLVDVFDMPVLGLNKPKDLSDDGWMSLREFHRRKFDPLIAERQRSNGIIREAVNSWA
jgi:hypothetical protein